MSSPIKMEVSHGTRENDQGQRSTNTIYEKQQGGQAIRHEDHHLKRAVSSKHEKLSLCFVFRPHEVIQPSPHATSSKRSVSNVAT
jgi:hypothetical protein